MFHTIISHKISAVMLKKICLLSASKTVPQTFGAYVIFLEILTFNPLTLIFP